MNNVKIWVVSAALLGPALSYRSIYMFHIIALIWISYAFFEMIKGGRVIVKKSILLMPLALFAFYAFITILWHPNFSVWVKYQFYLACGILCILSVYQRSNTLNDLNKVYEVISRVLVVNIFFGLLETFEILRLPSSYYSPYIGVYGIDQSNLIAEGIDVYDNLANKPSGFNFNYNTFGFVLLLTLPFITLHENKYIKSFGLLCVIWLLGKMGSKGLFATFIFYMFAILFYIKNYKKLKLSYLLTLFSFILIIILVVIVLGSNDISPDIERMLTAYDQIIILLQLINFGDIAPTDSTSHRAWLYLSGITELINSNGVGLGFGGIEAKLEESFHSFLLQLLVDLGVIVFLFVLYFYILLIRKLRNLSMNGCSHPTLNYYARASSLSLLIALPASTVPSGVHYQLTYYILIGFSLAVLKLYYLEK